MILAYFMNKSPKILNIKFGDPFLKFGDPQKGRDA